MSFLGKLVQDIGTKDLGLIIRKDVIWKDTDDQTHEWDFEVLVDGTTYLVDKDEILFVKSAKDLKS